MSLRQMEYLVEVVERESFTRAAEALHVTQSALSHQIKALEREVGGPLLERMTRGVRLTVRGGPTSRTPNSPSAAPGRPAAPRSRRAAPKAANCRSRPCTRRRSGSSRRSAHAGPASIRACVWCFMSTPPPRSCPSRWPEASPTWRSARLPGTGRARSRSWDRNGWCWSSRTVTRSPPGSRYASRNWRTARGCAAAWSRWSADGAGWTWSANGRLHPAYRRPHPAQLDRRPDGRGGRRRAADRGP